MGNRDDSMLYTGLTSASSRVQAETREQKIKDRENIRAKVTPAQEIINTVIEEEKLSALDLRGFVFNEVTPEKDIKAEMLAHKLNYNFIVRFQSRLNIALREPRKKGLKDE